MPQYRSLVNNDNRSTALRPMNSYRMSRAFRLWQLVCLLSLFLASGTGNAWAAPPVQVEGIPRWGFDGRVRLGQFNLLTVEFFNSSDRPWKGNPSLSSMAGVGGAGMPIRQPDLYIEGFGRRRIQFLVFVAEQDDIQLAWGRSPEEQIRLDAPSLARDPAIVQLSTELQVSAGVASLPKFYETDFPPNAAGLETLGEMYLDHVPPWTEAQIRTFRDWLHFGGKVHVCQRTGEFPEFTGALSFLNEPSDSFAYGGGHVLRHAETLAQAHDKLNRPITEAPRYAEYHPTTSMFQSLRDMTQPEHNWPVIYLMAVVYLLALFPGCWLLGRKRGDYRITYGALLGVIALFSLGFNRVGARGYGEDTSIHSTAVVRSGADGRGLVTQWSSIFVTRGGKFDITHPLEGVAYSAGESTERVPGTIINRPTGEMLTEIPSFSARTLVHTGVVAKGALQGKIASQELSNGTLRYCAIELENPVFSESQKCHAGWIVHRNRMYTAAVNGNTATLQGGGNTFSAVVNVSQWRNQGYNPLGYGEQKLSAEQEFARLPTPLMAHDLGMWDEQNLAQIEFPRDRIRLYLYADMPAELHTATPEIAKQPGRVLYVLNLPLDEAAP